MAEHVKVRPVSIVIPVYRGADSLPLLLREIAPLTAETLTPAGYRYAVSEVLLVHDCGPDHSDKVIEQLSEKYSFVRPVWLSRNFGQHAATMAGMASAVSDWVATLDEDGQQNPVDIGGLLDVAITQSAQVVYARPTNSPPHGVLRNLLSRTAKYITARILGDRRIGQFNSFRLVDGEIARTLAAYCGSGVFLDVGLFWITSSIAHAPVQLRPENARPSGYSYSRLFGHFWRLILTTGTRPLRLITFFGVASVALSVVVSCYALYVKFIGQMPVQGWTSLVIVVTMSSGAILTSLGIIAEYLALTLTIAMGKPLYVVTTKPTRSTVRP